MTNVRRLMAGVVVAAVLATSCGTEIGEDGLPAHCDEKIAVAIDGSVLPDAEPVSFEAAVRDRLGHELPRLRVDFPSADAHERSDGGDRVHLLYVTNAGEGRQASLKNDNGIQMLKVEASDRGGTWFVDSVETCSSMKKKFGGH